MSSTAQGGDIILRYDLQKLDSYVEKGLLRKAEDEQLVQYNYTEYCNNEGLWDDITSFNRGNIYEKTTGELIAQSMPKFMNFSQLSESEQKRFLSYNQLYTTEKKDGCLGILYLYKDEVRFNSRGGFENYVTESIKRILPKYIMIKKILQHNTLCVEVISPATKVICDYGDQEELFLLSIISKNPEIGELSEKEVDLAAQIMKMPRPKRNYQGWESLFRWAKEADWSKEGYVVCLPTKKFGCFERVKIKSEDYLRVAKLRICLTKHSVWKAWKRDIEQSSNLLEAFLNNVPDEFRDIAHGYLNELKEEMNKLKDEAVFTYHDTRNMGMKDLAIFLGNHPLKHAVFALRKGKDLERLFIKQIEPQEDKK